MHIALVTIESPWDKGKNRFAQKRLTSGKVDVLDQSWLNSTIRATANNLAFWSVHRKQINDGTIPLEGYRSSKGRFPRSFATSNAGKFTERKKCLPQRLNSHHGNAEYYQNKKVTIFIQICLNMIGDEFPRWPDRHDTNNASSLTE